MKTNNQEVYTDFEDNVLDLMSTIRNLEKMNSEISNQLLKLVKFRKSINEQEEFAEKRLIEATNQGARDEQYKWSGYLQGIRFVKSEL